MEASNFQHAFKVSLEDATGLENFLRSKQRLEEGEKVEGLEIAGQGNMNLVVRVKTSARSFILKQSRPYVQKYPSVAAPVSRISVEAQFYDSLNSTSVWTNRTPEIYWHDAENFLLCMQDLGVSRDFTDIYQKSVNLTKEEIAQLVICISELHNGVGSESPIMNTEMRTLNHAHIFDLPLSENNGFDLDGVLPGLQEASSKFKGDDKLKKRVAQLGDIYRFEQGKKLLHGDFYPGSWLRTTNGIKIIDPEFCFHGRPEFELGVMIAHLKMAQQSNSIMKDLFVYYHFDKQFDGSLFTKFAGVEIIRRIIGLAQLPLDLTLDERVELLDEARSLVING